MKVNNLFFIWQGRESEGKQRDLKSPKTVEEKQLLHYEKNMNRVGIGSLIREECMKCVTFINEMCGSAPQLSKGDFCGSDLVCVAWGVFIVR